MPTLGELMEKFGSAAAVDSGSENVISADKPAVSDGVIKTASGGESMRTLQDMYLALEQQDMHKAAAQAAYVPEPEPEVDFAKMAEQIASAEADEVIAEDGQDDIMKIASEYDAAGRIMARGFYDEFCKLAESAMDTDVTPNQNTETESAAATPAQGERGRPTVPTNYAGSDNHDQPIQTTGPGPKGVYADVLKAPGSMAAGSGTSNLQSEQGYLGHIATMKDLAGGKPA